MDIRKIRDDLNLTQAALAEALGVSVTTIQNWESGKPIPQTKSRTIEKNLSQLFSQSSVTNGQQGNNNTQINMPCPENDKRISELENEVARLTAELTHYKDIEKELRSSKADQDERIKELNERIAELKERNSELKNQKS